MIKYLSSMPKSALAVKVLKSRIIKVIKYKILARGFLLLMYRIMTVRDKSFRFR